MKKTSKQFSSISMGEEEYEAGNAEERKEVDFRKKGGQGGRQEDEK